MRWVVVLGLLASAGLAGIGALGVSVNSPLGGFVLLIVALALIWFAWRMFETDARIVYFDGEKVMDDSGVELCRLDQIETVDRGLAMWKPTGGFVVTLKAPLGTAWSPGLWWRLGRRIGVGGATPGKAGNAMADAIATALVGAQKD